MLSDYYTLVIERHNELHQKIYLEKGDDNDAAKILYKFLTHQDAVQAQYVIEKCSELSESANGKENHYSLFLPQK